MAPGAAHILLALRQHHAPGWFVRCFFQEFSLRRSGYVPDLPEKGRRFCLVVTMINLVGKSLEQIREATKDWSRHELQTAIYKLASCEPWFSPQELAALRGVSKFKIVELIRAGVLRAHKPLDNAYRIPLSGIHEWDRQTALFFLPNDKKS